MSNYYSSLGGYFLLSTLLLDCLVVEWKHSWCQFMKSLMCLNLLLTCVSAQYRTWKLRIAVMSSCIWTRIDWTFGIIVIIDCSCGSFLCATIFTLLQSWIKPQQNQYIAFYTAPPQINLGHSAIWWEPAAAGAQLGDERAKNSFPKFASERPAHKCSELQTTDSVHNNAKNTGNKWNVMVPHKIPYQTHLALWCGKIYSFIYCANMASKVASSDVKWSLVSLNWRPQYTAPAISS